MSKIVGTDELLSSHKENLDLQKQKICEVKGIKKVYSLISEDKLIHFEKGFQHCATMIVLYDAYEEKRLKNDNISPIGQSLYGLSFGNFSHPIFLIGKYMKLDNSEKYWEILIERVTFEEFFEDFSYERFAKIINQKISVTEVEIKYSNERYKNGKIKV